MSDELRFFDIDAKRWSEAWALHVTRDRAGYLHVNIEHFAASVGVPTDRAALVALTDCVHQYAERMYRQQLPIGLQLGAYSPKVTHH